MRRGGARAASVGDRALLPEAFVQHASRHAWTRLGARLCTSPVAGLSEAAGRPPSAAPCAARGRLRSDAMGYASRAQDLPTKIAGRATTTQRASLNQPWCIRPAVNRTTADPISRWSHLGFTPQVSCCRGA